MTNQSKARLSVISLLLAVAVGAPVASILGNAPSHRSTAALEPAIEMPAETVPMPHTIPVVDIVASPARTAPKKARGEWRCETRKLESVSDGMVKVCGTAI